MRDGCPTRRACVVGSMETVGPTPDLSRVGYAERTPAGRAVPILEYEIPEAATFTRATMLLSASLLATGCLDRSEEPE